MKVAKNKDNAARSQKNKREAQAENIERRADQQNGRSEELNRKAEQQSNRSER